MSADDRRLHGLDLARYLALAGMVLVNFRLAMAVPAEGEDGWQASSIFWKARLRRPSSRWLAWPGVGHAAAGWWPASVQTWRRALFLLVLGLLNLTLFPADILHYYAVYFALAVLWLRASPQVLLASIAGLAACSFWALLQWDYSQGWNWQTLEYAGLWHWPGAVRNLLFNGFHPCCPGCASSCWACCWHACSCRSRGCSMHCWCWALLLIGRWPGRAAACAGNALAGVAGNAADAAGTGLRAYRAGAACSVIAACLWLAAGIRGLAGAVHRGRAHDPDPVCRPHPAGHGHAGKPGPARWQCFAASVLLWALLFLMLATGAAWLWSWRFARGRWKR
jgi:hypothetical protein